LGVGPYKDSPEKKKRERHWTKNRGKCGIALLQTGARSRKNLLRCPDFEEGANNQLEAK